MMPATPASFTCCIMFSFSSPVSSFASTITGIAGTLRAAAGWLWLAATKRRLAGATPRLNDAAAGSIATNTVPTRAETRMAKHVLRRATFSRSLAKMGGYSATQLASGVSFVLEVAPRKLRARRVAGG
jgi:hypothetical protein